MIPMNDTMNDLPTREEAQAIVDGAMSEIIERELLGELLHAYIVGDLMAREEWVKTLKNAPTIEWHYDGNEWTLTDESYGHDPEWDVAG